jgi:hypothetical protein
MSRKENHRYLRSIWLRAFRPRWTFNRWSLALVVVLVVINALFSKFRVFERPNASLLLVVGFPLLVVGALYVMVIFVRARSAHAYVAALQSETPDALIALLEKTLARATQLPDFDAFRAQSLAIGYALYGRAAAAREMLAAVRWSERSPLIQAAGLSAECLIALVCDQDVERGLELTRRATALSDMARAVPGSAATRRAHACHRALAEVLAGSEAEEHVRALRDAIAAKHLPALRIQGYAGLITWAQRQGDAAAIARYRGELHALAPRFDAMLFDPPKAGSG